MTHFACDHSVNCELSLVLLQSLGSETPWSCTECLLSSFDFDLVVLAVTGVSYSVPAVQMKTLRVRLTAPRCKPESSWFPNLGDCCCCVCCPGLASLRSLAFHTPHLNHGCLLCSSSSPRTCSLMCHPSQQPRISFVTMYCTCFCSPFFQLAFLFPKILFQTFQNMFLYILSSVRTKFIHALRNR